MLIDILIGTIIGIAVLSVIEMIIILMLKKEITSMVGKVEKYLQYILEGGEEEVNATNNIEETEKEIMDEKQKELLIQEVLGAFLN